MRHSQIFGGDLSLNHGAIVRLVYNHTDDLIASIDEVHRWDKKDKSKLTLKSTPKEILEKADTIKYAIFHRFPKDVGETLVVDWSPQSVYWRTRKIQIVQMSLFMGMLFATKPDYNISVDFVSASDLRSFWGLPSNVSKEKLQEIVLSYHKPPPLFLTWAEEDDIDAYILALYKTLYTGNILNG